MPDLSASANRVLWWHHLLFRSRATVVLRARERDVPHGFAALHGAARTLSEVFAARVIIDASENLMSENGKVTMREKVVEVGPMSRSVLESVPDLAELLKALKAADLADVVWACLGGVPAKYIQLLVNWGGGRGRDLEDVVEPFLQAQLRRAIEYRDQYVVATPRLQELYALFRDQDEVLHSVLREMTLTRPSPDKILRTTSTEDCFLIPADAATAIILRFGLTEAPRLRELMELMRNNPPPTSRTASV